MIVARITKEYMLKIPDEFRPLIEAGQEVAISADAQGRLVVTPIEQIRARLLETFGMWAGRDDAPIDGVDYVDDIRRGHRLDNTQHRLNEAH
jgi:hypothetical protein